MTERELLAKMFFRIFRDQPSSMAVDMGPIHQDVLKMLTEWKKEIESSYDQALYLQTK